MKNIIIILIVFLFAINLNAQNGKYDFKWISYDELFKADVNNVIKVKSKMSPWRLDSVQCFYFKGKYWHTLPVKEIDGKIYGQIFVYDRDKKILQTVSDSLIDFIYYTSSLTERTFKDNLYYIVYYNYGDEEEKTNYDKKIVVIDTDKNEVKKEVPLKNDCDAGKIKEMNDMLYIYVQPLKKIFNYNYLLTFWFPRGRSEKYKTIPDGNTIIYKFDKDFNLIEKETMNYVDEYYSIY